MKTKKIIIIGAGPAGLSSAYEIIKNSPRDKYQITIIEKESYVGGISRTVNYKGYKFDIGGHRYFSKNKKINQFWKTILPQKEAKKQNKVFLKRKRKTRIFFLNNFFDYPISLNFQTLKKLGLKKSLKIISSYLKTCFLKIKPEKNLEDFYINRFGEELYKTFFKNYTKKVWGVDCKNIPKNWGQQRIKGVSISKVLLDFFQKKLNLKNKKQETSLISHFFILNLDQAKCMKN